jgi:prenyltransferase beta subunit
MSRRLQMLQVARLARRSLGESADLVVSFLKSRSAPGGGYADRGGNPDLYYTPFASDALIGLDAYDPGDQHAAATRAWLATFGAGADLDFVHRCCLARAWAAHPAAACDAATREAILAGILAHRAADGGFATRTAAARGTAYGCFLAVNACADLLRPLADTGPDADAIVACLAAVRAADGGWANEPGRPRGTTPATAAALTTLRSFGRPIPDDAVAWLLARRHPGGGFTAAPDAPMPDLLSTAVALHALDAVEAPWREWRDEVLDFIDTLWSAEGAFHGSWADDEPDAEYTFYGLVALGHASV